MELVVKMHFHQNYFVIGERIAGYPVSGDTGYPVFRLAGWPTGWQDIRQNQYPAKLVEGLMSEHSGED